MLTLLGAAALAATTHDPATWTSVNLQVDLDAQPDTGPRLWTDLHFRRTDANFVGIARPAFGWDVARGVGVYVGYGWIPTYGESTDDQLVNEHRVWEQLLLTKKLDAVQLGLRPRFEQRVVAGEEGTGLRVRLWGRAAVPVSDRISLVVTDEVFVGLVATDWSVAGFDQNRLFVGPAFPIEGLGRVEFGYMNTFVLRESGNTDLHIASANLFLNL
jgi:hypothetical protein